MVFLSPHGRCFRHRIYVTLVIIIRSVGVRGKQLVQFHKIDLPDVGLEVVEACILTQNKARNRILHICYTKNVWHLPNFCNFATQSFSKR